MLLAKEIVGRFHSDCAANAAEDEFNARFRAGAMPSDIPEVTECYNISGAFDYLLKIHASDMKHYQEFILNVLGRIDHLGSLESVFVMDELKHEYGIHL